MKNLHKNQQGFGIVEIIIVIAVLVIIGLVGWRVYAARSHDAATQDSSTKSNATSAQAPKSSADPQAAAKIDDPYAGWNSYRLAYEGFSFKYPSTFTLTDESSTSAAEYVAPGQDRIKLTKANGFEMHISTGLFQVGGGPCDCTVSLSNLMTALGQPLHLNYVDYGNDKIGRVVLTTIPDDVSGGGILGETIKNRQTGEALPISIGASYTKDDLLVYKPLSEYAESADMADVVKILESMTY